MSKDFFNTFRSRNFPVKYKEQNKSEKSIEVKKNYKFLCHMILAPGC